MNTMNKKAALCNQLNMNFEEANELFDNESLESMQMARVNGGISALGSRAALKALIKGIQGVLDVIDFLKSTTILSPKDPTPAASSMEAVTNMVEDLIKNAKPGDTVNFEVECVEGNKIEGITLTITLATPAPTKAQ